MDSVEFHPPESPVHTVLGVDMGILRDLAGTNGPETLRAMRSVWTQHRELPVDRARLAEFGHDVDSVGWAARVLEAQPHGFAPEAETRVTFDGLAARGGQLDRLISWWAATFGAYTPTGNHVPNVPTYAPVFDYAADPLVERALTVAVDYDFETARSVKLKLSFKGIGVTGTASSKISTKISVPATSDAFQVSVPVELALTEYVGPMQNDIRYTASVVQVHAPVHLTPKDVGRFTDIQPRTAPLIPAPFLTSTGLGVGVAENIARSKGLEATAEATLGSGLKLGIEYKTRAQAEIGVVYTKTRTDAIERQLWHKTSGLVRILEPKGIGSGP